METPKAGWWVFESAGKVAGWSWRLEAGWWGREVDTNTNTDGVEDWASLSDVGG